MSKPVVAVKKIVKKQVKSKVKKVKNITGNVARRKIAKLASKALAPAVVADFISMGVNVTEQDLLEAGEDSTIEPEG